MCLKPGEEAGYEILVLDDNSICDIKTFFLEGGISESAILRGRITLEKPASHWVAFRFKRGVREGDLDSVQGHQAIVGKDS